METIKNKILSVVIPAYLEAENLRVLLPRIKESCDQLGVDYEIIVVDTMEPKDDTRSVCLKHSVRYINRRGGNNYGDAVRTGISEASGQYTLFMDADGSHTPEFIKELFSKHEQADVVIASRYVEGGETDNGWHLVLMSNIVNMIYSVVLGLPCKDVSNSFKLYRTLMLKEISLECNNFDIVEEILFRMKHKHPKVKILELPYTFKKRMFGETKRNLFIFMATYLWTLVRLRLSVIDIGAHRTAFLRFSIVGAVGVITNLIVFSAALALLGGYITASVLAFTVAVTQNFALNREWSFSGRGAGSSIKSSYARYVFVNLGGLLVNLAILHYGVVALGMHPIAAQLFGVAAGMMVNYVGAHLFVFKVLPVSNK